MSKQKRTASSLAKGAKGKPERFKLPAYGTFGMRPGLSLGNNPKLRDLMDTEKPFRP